MDIERDGDVKNQKNREKYGQALGRGGNAYTNISVDTPALSIEVEVTNESHHGPLVGVAPWNGFRLAFAALRDRATVFYEPMGIEHLLGPAFGSIDWYFLRAQGIMGRGQAVHV